MSGYATRLAARGMGRAAGALLAPRPVPRAVPSASPSGTEAVGLVREHRQTTERRVEAERARDATSAPSIGRRRAKPAAPTRERPPATAPTERAHEVRISAGRIQSVPESSAAALATPAVPGLPTVRTHSPAAPGAQAPIVRLAPGEDVAASPVELQPRPVAQAPIPASPAARAAAQAEAQTVEVRIGKVEVRAPRPRDLPGWRTSGTAPVAPPVPGEQPFARMAAARRYLDRGWG